MARDILSELFGDEDEDFDVDEKPSQKDLPKVLRQKIKDLQDEVRTLRGENAQFKQEAAKATLGSLLEKNGYKPSLAKFVVKDLEEVTEESVKAWLDENGDLFAGAKISQEPQAPDGGTEATPQSVAQNRMTALADASEVNRPITVAADLEARINAAKSMEELQQILQSTGL